MFSKRGKQQIERLIAHLGVVQCYTCDDNLSRDRGRASLADGGNIYAGNMAKSCIAITSNGCPIFCLIEFLINY